MLSRSPSRRGACSALRAVEMWYKLNVLLQLQCLLSVLFVSGTGVLLNASTEALPTVQISNASIALHPGS